ncbi:MAG: alpha/beta hydrolase [Pseudomonadota bacterium]
MRRTLAILLAIIAILAAGWLALRRADIPYDTLELVYSVPDSQFITLDDGLKIHFTDTGPRDHPTLVLVHGFSASLHTWSAWKYDLQDDYRVITLDLPGHGLSRAEDPDAATMQRFSDVVLDVTEQLDAEYFTIAGNSMGGAVAWQTALTAPDRVDGLILVDASGWAEDAGENDSEPLIFTLLGNPLARVVLKDIDLTAMVRSGLEGSYVDQSFVTDELVERYVSLARAPGHRATLLQLMAGEREPLTKERLAVLDQPTLILWGREDNLVPVSSAHKFAEAIPQAELIIYDDIGHLPQEEAAAASITDVRAFMLNMELQALDEEFVEPAGDPRLIGSRGGAEGAP